MCSLPQPLLAVRAAHVCTLTPDADSYTCVRIAIRNQSDKVGKTKQLLLSSIQSQAPTLRHTHLDLALEGYLQA
jgi:hypothetical protein